MNDYIIISLLGIVLTPSPPIELVSGKSIESYSEPLYWLLCEKVYLPIEETLKLSCELIVDTRPYQRKHPVLHL